MIVFFLDYQVPATQERQNISGAIFIFLFIIINRPIAYHYL